MSVSSLQTGYRKCLYSLTLFTLATFTFATPLMAQSPEPTFERSAATYKKREKSFTPEDHQHDIKRVEDYLSSFRTLKANFSQVSPGIGMITRGTVYISRPGKTRWEYQNPSPSVLVVNGKRVMFYDQELEQVSYSDVPPSPLHMLLQEKITLDQDVRIVDVDKKNDSLSISMVPRADLVDDPNTLPFSSLTLVFDRTPLLHLTRVHSTDMNKNTTIIRLKQTHYDITLDDHLFSLADPRRNKTR